MIIVSQDRKRIVENLNLGIRYKGEYNQNYVIYNTEIEEDLGEYATEERAKEILQEIIEQYEYCQVLQEGHGLSLSSGYNYVYSMPKE